VDGLVVSTVTLGSNIASLNVQRQLGENTDALSRLYERLSSGLRINRASDDAAGLSVASGLNAGARIYTQAARNLNDSVSGLQIADSALNSLSAITVRQKELATQAAQGILGTSQRAALDKEAQALAQEFNRIISTTTFNHRQLIASPNTLSVQAGIGGAESLQINVGSSLAYSTTTAPGSAAVSGGTDESALFSNFSFGSEYSDVFFGDGSNFNSGDGAGNDPGLSGETEVDISSGSTATDIALTMGYGLLGAGIVTAADGIITTTGEIGFHYQPALGGNGIVSNTGGIGVADQYLESNPTIGSYAQSGYGVGAYFNISSPTTNYYVWSGGFDPSPGGTGIQVNLLSGDSSATIAAKIATAITAAAGSSFTVNANSGNLTITNKTAGTPLSSWTIGDTALSISHLASGVNPGVNSATDRFTATSHGFSTGDAVTASLNGGGSLPGPLSSATTYYIIKVDNNTFKLATSASNAQSGTAIDITSTGSGYTSLTFTGTSNSSTTTTNAESFDLLSQSSALSALDTLDRQFQRISVERGSIGAFMSRINAALSVVRTRSDEYRAAASRIMDTDIASDSANMVRVQILQQAASAVLGQANQQPALALQLLR
jgi:flagellin